MEPQGCGSHNEMSFYLHFIILSPTQGRGAICQSVNHLSICLILFLPQLRGAKIKFIIMFNLFNLFIFPTGHQYKQAQA